MSPGAPPIIRVLVVDDHFIVRHGLVDIIRNEPDMRVVAEASDGEQAVALHRKHRPDITLMDLRMPRMDGHQATAAIVKEFPASRVIVLTAYSGDAEARQALAAGACFYLLKDAPREALVDAIRSVHRGERRTEAAPSDGAKERMNAPELSEREHEVLRLIAQGRTNREIAESLYLSEGAVRSHLARVFKKMGAGDRKEAVMRALQRGMLRVDQEADPTERT